MKKNESIGESIGEYIDIDLLIPNPKNPRKNEHAIEHVAKSIERFGFASPIVARRKNNMIIAGHTRYLASKEIGLSKVPVRFVDLNQVDSELLMLADNKLSEISDWNYDLLAKEIEVLSEDYKLDLLNIGFSEEELEDLLNVGSSELEEVEEENNNNDYDEFDNTKPTLTRFKEGTIIDIGKHKIICGDCVEVMKSIDENSIDSICCDPPYGIAFMGKDWDKENSFDLDEWSKQCLRILKPGGHLIAFAATRTIHKIMISLENNGFEIRDMISWIYFSGFPKSHNVSKAIDKHFGAEREVVVEGFTSTNEQGLTYSKGLNANFQQRQITKPKTKEAIKFDGFGTNLKPAQEPAVLCRKPLEKGLSIAENVLKWGTGGLNIDECRFGYGDSCWVGPQNDPLGRSVGGYTKSPIYGSAKELLKNTESNDLGRWPANIYQCSKASRSEREEGLEDHESKTGYEAVQRKEGSKGLSSPRAGSGRTATEVKNFHPTVKPIKLFRWLVKLITPIEGTVIDPFCGSGTTLLSAEIEAKYKSIGIEMNPDYCEIIYGRLKNQVNK